MTAMTKFVTDNWKGLLGLLVYVAVGYAGYKELQNTVDTNGRRLQTYIKVIKDQEKKIHELDKQVAILQATNCK